MAANAVTPHYRDAAGAGTRVATAAAMPSSTTNRLVSFGFGSLKTPQPNNGAASNAEESSRETLRQYALYRSAPAQFPSYDRMRFVRLPRNWLPEGLRGPSSNANENDSEGKPLLRRWPALIYNNLAELVRDLSPLESKILKAKLILEHRKAPHTVVARLLAWKTSAGSSSGNVNPFEESKLELIRLSGSSLGENEQNSTELMSFVDGQLELESICADLLQGKSSGNEADEAVVKHALKFRRAVDMALNCLAIDVGADPLPPRSDDEEENIEEDHQLAMVAKAPSSNKNRALETATVDVNRDISKQKSVFSVEKCKPASSISMAKNVKKKALAHRQERAMSPMRKPTAKVGYKKTYETAAGDKENQNSSRGRAMSPVRKSQERGLSPMRKSQERAMSPMRKPTTNVGYKKTYETAAGDKENQSSSSVNASSHCSKQEHTKESRSNVFASVGLKPRPEAKSPKAVVVPKKNTFQPSPAAAKIVARAKRKNKNKQSKKPVSCPNRTGASTKPSFNRLQIPKKPASAQAIGVPAFSFNDDDDDDEGDTPWKETWAAMKKSGWTWKGGSGLMTDYYYVKPGCGIKNGIEGRDYFVSEQDTQAYARNVYGWGRVSMEELMTTIEECAKYEGEIVPLLKEGEEIEPNEPWGEVWEKMLASGWKWKAGCGLMMDYYYIKPGSNIKGGVEDRDYFCKKEDVQKFAVRNYGWTNDVQEGEEKVEAMLGAGKRRSSRDRDSGKHEVQEKRQKVERTRTKAASEKLANLKAAKKQFQGQQKASRIQEPIDLVDDEESVSDNRSTYSQSGFHSSNKTLFQNENANVTAPPLKDTIDPHETWSNVWGEMRDSGWTWKVGTGLMTDYYYIKPGCKVKGGIEGQDYFVTEEDAKKFAMKHYGWRGEEKASAAGGSPNKSPNKRRRKSTEKDDSAKKRSKVDVRIMSNTPKHKALALKAQKAIKAKAPKHTAASAPLSSKTKKALWQALQNDGWKAISAGKYNKLHDWYYISPGCSPGDGRSKLGVDYFLSEEDAIQSAKPSSRLDKAAKKKLTEEKFNGANKSSKPANDDGLLTPINCRTKPQDPAIPLLSSPEVSCTSSKSNEDYYEWNNLWPILERAGWNIIKAGRYNPLHDWYYVRPSRHPGDGSSKLGRHYFTCEHDVIEFVKWLDKESSRKGGKKKNSRKSVGMMLESFEEEARSAP